MTRMSKFKATWFFFSVYLAIVIGSTHLHAAGSQSNGHVHDTKMAIGETGKFSEVTRTIKIKMFDNYYDPKEISVNAGETVRFVVENAGEFVHEFNIATTEMHAAHQKEMMMMMEHGALEVDKINHVIMKMNMGSGKTMEHNDPNSVLLEPSKAGEVIWKFTKVRALEFACNVPGHYDSGMMGQVRFK
jgi:uncharacterized cupredoxin-like copper-binding protein